ncbi:MAG: SusF/SusE family outer membrane protein [Tannerella sp.]|jgi:hypothetical protein|nr:SusF/SusE family outer membrane protein [Tannerella sp.]
MEYRYILPAVLGALALTACNKEQDMYKVLPPDQVQPPVLTAHDDIVIGEADLDAGSTTFYWQGADFGVPTATTYSLYVKKASDATDVAPILISSSNADSIEVSYSALNKQLIAAGIVPNEPTDMDFLLEASISAAYDTIPSAPLTVKVTAYKPKYPDNMYMIGQEFGAWDWNSAGVVSMTPVNGMPGNFWCIRYFSTPTDGFKWCSTKAWGSDFYSLGSGDSGFTNDGGNAYVAAPGLYMVYMDMPNNKISIEPAQVYGIGDCFGDWTTGKYPFTIDGQTMKITTTAAGDVRMYAYSSAAPITWSSNWWTTEFIVDNGVIVYRGNGGDQNRVSVAAGKTVTLDFNAGTGSIE